MLLVVEMERAVSNFTCFVFALLVDPASSSDLNKCVNCYRS